VKTPAAISMFLVATCSATITGSALGQMPTAQVSEQEAYEIVRDAYVYAYPMVLTDLSLRQQTNFVEPTGKLAQAPLNQFSHAREFTPPDWKVVVRPNVDTLYSPATLDLGPEPIVLSVPATDRYFVMPMMSLWTDIFAVPGTRTTGRNTARDFLIVAPNWRGAPPSGLEIIRSPTRIMNIGGRTQTNGAADYANVHKIQAGYKLTPLSAWGKGTYTPPAALVDPGLDMVTPPPAQVERMDAAAFFARFAELLKDNPPGPFDYPMLHRLERVGFTAGRSFDLALAPPDIKRAFERGAADGKVSVTSLGEAAGGKGAKGWVYTTRSGAYGVDYSYRAAIAYCCLGENLPQDAVYPSLAVDSEGRQLDGRYNYTLHFAKGKLPPVDAFWSVTAYDAVGYLIPNTINRQALGDRDRLVSGGDGSIDLYIQAASPGPASQTNWLPVAKAPFTLLIRLYSPKSEVLDGSWSPPLPVRRQ
jgi:hypothetical protein